LPIEGPIRFKPDADKGYRELVGALRPHYASISGYDPKTVVHLLASMWAHPANEYEATKLLTGKPAQIYHHLQPPEGDYKIEAMGVSSNLVRFLHGCDILFYRYEKDNPLEIISMFAKDRCFLSLDPISTTDFEAGMFGEYDYRGVFVVYQLGVRAFPEWSEAVWKSFQCEVQPHIIFSMP
jgi:hypothetical protein